MHTDINIHTNTLFLRLNVSRPTTGSVVRGLTNVCYEWNFIFIGALNVRKIGLENFYTYYQNHAHRMVNS